MHQLSLVSGTKAIEYLKPENGPSFPPWRLQSVPLTCLRRLPRRAEWDSPPPTPARKSPLGLVAPQASARRGNEDVLPRVARERVSERVLSGCKRILQRPWLDPTRAGPACQRV